MQRDVASKGPAFHLAKDFQRSLPGQSWDAPALFDRVIEKLQINLAGQFRLLPPFYISFDEGHTRSKLETQIKPRRVEVVAAVGAKDALRLRLRLFFYVEQKPQRQDSAEKLIGGEGERH
jgi:hypothetical protein